MFLVNICYNAFARVRFMGRNKGGIRWREGSEEKLLRKLEDMCHDVNFNKADSVALMKQIPINREFEREHKWGLRILPLCKQKLLTTIT